MFIPDSFQKLIRSGHHSLTSWFSLHQSTVSIWQDPSPVRAELFSVERLESHAKTLANSQQVTNKPIRVLTLADRLTENAAVLLQAFRTSTAEVEAGRAVVPAAEWLLDNYHVVEQHIREIRDHLPPHFYRQLPKLASGPFAGYPRVFGVAWAYVAHTDSHFDPVILQRFLLAYQQVQPLTIGELWALSLTLRIVLVENLRRLADQISVGLTERAKADELTLLLQQNESPHFLNQASHQALANLKLPLSDAFAAQMAKRLRDLDQGHSLALTWLTAQLAAQGSAVEVVVQQSQQRLGASNLSVRNVMTSMQRISAIDWASLFEQVSLVELRLNEHQNYPLMDFASRNMYRSAIEVLARGSVHSEQQVAQLACAAADHAAMAAEAGEDQPLNTPTLTEAEVLTDQTPAEQAAKSRLDQPAQDLGYYLLGSGRAGFEQQLKFQPNLRQRLNNRIRHVGVTGYLMAIAGTTLLLMLAAAAILWQIAVPVVSTQSESVLPGWSWWLILAVLAIFPFSELATALCQRLFSYAVGPVILPALALTDGVPTDYRTLIVVPMLLTREADILAQVERLEVHHLSGCSGDLTFALLTDYLDADEQHGAADLPLLNIAIVAIAQLNQRYPAGPAGPRFLLLHRQRLFNPGEQKWMGWERKRGKLTELNALLRGAINTSFVGQQQPPPTLNESSSHPGATTVLSCWVPADVRYVLTLDADTQLPRNAAFRLIGKMAHPLNRPQFDPVTQRISSGYGILQPRVTPALALDHAASRYQRLYTGPAGIDPYAAAASDLYQDLFGEGSFTGKGIYDVDAFAAALSDRIGENALLSHDLFEGVFARSGLASDVDVVEDFPARYDVAAKRQHRWVRGDWQLLPWLLRSLFLPCLELPKKLPALGRWKMLDNLRRSLVSPTLLAALLWFWCAPLPLALGGTLLLLLTLLIPNLLPLWGSIWPQHSGIQWRPHLQQFGQDLHLALCRFGMSLCLLVDESWRMVSAIAITLWRLAISRSHLLQWTTSAQTDLASRLTVRGYYQSMLFSTSLALLAVLALCSQQSFWWLLLLPLPLSWLAAPALVWWLSQPQPQFVSAPLSTKQQQQFRLIARRTWRYFETFVTAEDHFLPPDNFQQLPKAQLAHRTSPTNIGLYLLAILSARDFGWISLAQALQRLQQTFSTLALLTRYRGHFLNWYDSSDLRVLPPAYVSAVDSGNLAGHLIALANGCELWAQERTFRQTDLESQVLIQSWRDQLFLAQLALEQLTDNPAYCCKHAAADTVLPLLDQLTKQLNQLSTELLKIDPSLPVGSETKISLQNPEQHQLHSPLEQAVRQSMAAALETADKIHQLLSVNPIATSETGTPTPGSAPQLDTASHSHTSHSEPDQELAQQSATLLFYLAALNQSFSETILDQNQQPAERREQNQLLRTLANQARQMALEMDFAFLIAPDRDLLSIGYALETNQLDESCYDLLASEARLASLFAIAKGDASSKHWFRLGRSATPLYQASALLSWSGSMFEYLMPSLVMRAPAGSLLEQTNRLVVARQIDYASALQIPWGISESSYNARDLELTYQYSNFGVPGLGLKRGLAENLVIAPYATALGAMVQPVAASENFQKLADIGACGRYGFVEAIDFTKSRLRQGQRFALVQSFMAHHQGMTLVAIANLLQQGLMRRRFHREPMIQACELLLQERLPRHIAINHPRAEEAKVSGVRDGIEVLTERQLLAQEYGAPVCHLLSNGHYALMLSAAGAGYSRWRHIAITRWQEDSTVDAQGSFVLLRDVSSGKVYTPTLQPLPEQALAAGSGNSRHHLTFSEDRAEFFQQQPDLLLSLDVLVCAEDDGEVRRLTLVNRTNQSRQFDVMSYAELVLTTVANDLAHPAFAKMFVQTEFDAAAGALLATRRLRSDRETAIWVAHFVVVEAIEVLPLQFQTSRALFFGEASTLATAQALNSGQAWSDTTGTVLDPVFALKQRIEVAPGKTARLAFWTLVAESKAELLVLIDQHNERSAFERAAMLAWTQAQVQLRYLAVTVAEAADFQRLASAILYADGRFRAPMATILRGAGPQSGLWQHSISGDLPIVLCHIDDIEDLACLKQLLLAHEYWGLKRLAVDLVIINEHAASYVQDLQGAIENLVRNSQSRRAALLAQRNGRNTSMPAAGGQIYPLRADLMSVESRALIQSVARVVLYARRGLIGRQLGRLPQVPMQQQQPYHRPAASQDTPPVLLARPTALEFDNGLAGFGQAGREYQIQQSGTSRTPMPWLNVIANTKFGFQVSADGSGYSWAINSREYQLTPWSNDPVSDPISEVLYVRDEQSLHWSCATAKPKRDGGSYHCSHGVGYSRFEHQQQELDLTLTQFVVMDEALKISTLTIKNLANRERKLSITGYVDWVLGRNRSLTAASLITEFDSSSGFILVRNPWSGAFGGNFAFAAFSVPATGWTCDRAEFIGRNSSLASPQALRRRNKLSGSCGAGLDPCAALQQLQTLAAGGETEVIFMLGHASSVAEAQMLVQRFSEAGAAKAALEGVAAHWQPLLGAVQLKTPDRALDIMLNGWLLYQTLACRIYARSAFYQSSGAYGFRDQLQDGMALSFCAPAITRQHLLRAAGRQFAAGDVQHWWLPHTGEGVRSRISDDRIWLVFACSTYVNSSGDSAVWQERIGFLVGPPLNHDQHDAFFQPMHSDETATLFEHCGRALDQSLSLLGAHGLPLMGGGDWNDGMDQVGIDGRGESVWLGWFVVKTLKLFLPLALDILEDEAVTTNGYRDKLAVRIENWQTALAAMIEALEQHSWDGQWYRRATYDNGDWLGSVQSDECQLDSIAQSFAQLSGAADPTRAKQAMDSVLQRLWLKPQQMLLLFKPPFDQTPNNPGYIKGYPPGLRENGGQYSHAAMWVVLALTSMHRGFEAHQLLSQLNPIAHALDKTALQIYQVEPYVVAADVYSVAPHQGRGGWTWYTGAAGWMYRAAIEGLLGIRRQGDSLLVKPCLPPEWPGYSAEIVIEQSRYQLQLLQLTIADMTASLVLDGVDVSDQPQYFDGAQALILPLDGKSHQLCWQFRSSVPAEDREFIDHELSANASAGDGMASTKPKPKPKPTS